MVFFNMNAEETTRLLACARASITQGVIGGGEQRPTSLDQEELGACFVTLSLNGSLRGCIGSLEASRPLTVDVWENAYSAALNDPRFPPLDMDELGRVKIEISVITPALLLSIDSEQDLIDKIRPGIDGLLLEDGSHRATFLPAVWEVLPNVRDFIVHLKRKAGFADNYWSDSIKFSVYQAIKLTE
ncbi:AmmeMemoRadiSam system protein A [Neptunomonas sp.]|uniref:AmmeMemoRadiSam system protein A n=1 Tax=Neptunomonas sp. TaxID=1971898 RepID=UPI0025D168D4|nr:AmmeMemoRadiSam system protein A [Neptunomonas sp.]